jgi:hypothetical protein
MEADSSWLRSVVQAELDTHGAPLGGVFDVHSHTGLDIDGSARSCDEQASELEGLGGRSVVFPLCVTTGYRAENERVIEECRRHPERLVPFARVDPRTARPDADASVALTAGARGLKLHPRAEAFRLDHPGVDAILAVASEAGVPVVVHAGMGVGSLGKVLVDLARRHRDCRIVLAHAGISDLGWLWRDVAEHPNLFFDTAWWNPVDLLALFALVPPGRILWGSDAPYGEVDLGLAITLRCARFAGLDDDELALVTGRQLDVLLGGGEPVDAGPPPGPADRGLSPAESRALSWLTGVGGCLLGGGDPAGLIEVARIAMEPWRRGPSGAGADGLLVELVELMGRAPEDARSALILALTLAATPGLRVGCDSRVEAVTA